MNNIHGKIPTFGFGDSVPVNQILSIDELR